jgi:hypothetical protein
MVVKERSSFMDSILAIGSNISKFNIISPTFSLSSFGRHFLIVNDVVRRAKLEIRDWELWSKSLVVRDETRLKLGGAMALTNFPRIIFLPTYLHKFFRNYMDAPPTPQTLYISYFGPCSPKILVPPLLVVQLALCALLYKEN